MFENFLKILAKITGPLGRLFFCLHKKFYPNKKIEQLRKISELFRNNNLIEPWFNFCGFT